MQEMNTLTQERLKHLYDYNPETGLFTGKLHTGGFNKIGGIAGSPHGNGYIRIFIDGKRYLAHRLAFLYMTGKFPEDQVDHKDTIRHHNWWSNLREANNSQNQQNLRKAQKNNKTGYLGVYPSGKKFKALISNNGKQIKIGVFNTAEEAHRAYVEAKREIHGFNTL